MSKILDSTKGTGVATKRTICEVHRNIYDIIVLEILESNPKLAKNLSDLLEEAFVMGIKMAKKLKKYKYNIGEDLDFNEKEPARLLRERRVELLDKMKNT